MLQASEVSTKKELQQVLALQQLNLRGVNTQTEEKEQGFVTLSHSIEILEQMQQLEPSIIVKDNDVLAGFALVMSTACSELIPDLYSMFAGLASMKYQQKPLSAYKYYVMGQVCVAKEYRGKGVFDMLYMQHKKMLGNKYDFVVTEVATRNKRSMRAHERVGFKIINVYRDELDEWAVILWDWSDPLNNEISD